MNSPHRPLKRKEPDDSASDANEAAAAIVLNVNADSDDNYHEVENTKSAPPLKKGVIGAGKRTTTGGDQLGYSTPKQQQQQQHRAFLNGKTDARDVADEDADADDDDLQDADGENDNDNEEDVDMLETPVDGQNFMPPPPVPSSRTRNEDARSVSPSSTVEQPQPTEDDITNGTITCTDCGQAVLFKDPQNNGFTLKLWNEHRKVCHANASKSPSSLSATLSNGGGGGVNGVNNGGRNSSHPPPSSAHSHPPASSSSPTHPSTHPPHSNAHPPRHTLAPNANAALPQPTNNINNPLAGITVPHPSSTTSSSLGPPQKKRRAKRTEEERIDYLRTDRFVAQFEPYRVLCASCNKWIRLRPNSTYCSIPWDAHRKSCLSKRSQKRVQKTQGQGMVVSPDHPVMHVSAANASANGGVNGRGGVVGRGEHSRDSDEPESEDREDGMGGRMSRRVYRHESNGMSEETWREADADADGEGEVDEDADADGDVDRRGGGGSVPRGMVGVVSDVSRRDYGHGRSQRDHGHGHNHAHSHGHGHGHSGHGHNNHSHGHGHSHHHQQQQQQHQQQQRSPSASAHHHHHHRHSGHGSGTGVGSGSAAGTKSTSRRGVSPTMAELDDTEGRVLFIAQSVEYLFRTTYERSDEMTINALLNYLNAAMPVDKYEDFDVQEVAKAVKSLSDKGKLVLEGDSVRPAK